MYALLLVMKVSRLFFAVSVSSRFCADGLGFDLEFMWYWSRGHVVSVLFFKLVSRPGFLIFLLLNVFVMSFAIFLKITFN